MSVLRDYAAAVTQPTLPFASPRGSSARFDEVIAPDGTLRPAWRAMAPGALTLTIDDSDAGGPTGNGEKCTAGVYMDGIAPSPPPTVAPAAK